MYHVQNLPRPTLTGSNGSFYTSEWMRAPARANRQSSNEEYTSSSNPRRSVSRKFSAR